MKNKILKAFLGCSLTKDKKLSYSYLSKIINTINFEFRTLKYSQSKFKAFEVLDPVKREIFAPDFKDRIVHRFIINEIEDEIDKKFIYDSCGNRKNKGTHFAINRLKKFTKNKKNKYYLQLDISGFFRNIDHSILFNLVEENILNIKNNNLDKKLLIYLCKQIIFTDIKNGNYYFLKNKILNLKSNPKSLLNQELGKGLPIGSLTSQFFANLYLNELDQFIKHELKIKYYIRYVDDFIILGSNLEELEEIKLKIEIFLKSRLDLELNHKKTKLRKISSGIDFLGFIVKNNYTLVRQRIVKALKNKLYFYNHILNPNIYSYKANYPKGYIKEEIRKGNLKLGGEFDTIHLISICKTINTYYSIFNKANSKKLRWNLYHNHFGELKKYLDCTGIEKSKIKIRPRFLQIENTKEIGSTT